jgi:hypothetical protein
VLTVVINPYMRSTNGLSEVAANLCWLQLPGGFRKAVSVSPAASEQEGRFREIYENYEKNLLAEQKH